MKLEVNKFKLKKVILSSFVLLVSFASALTATYAWFTVKRDADSSLGNISISDSVNKYEAFYYSGNFKNIDGQDKYTGYQKPAQGISITGKTYGDFIKFNPTSNGDLFIKLPELFPDTRYSFAMEITLNPGVTATSCGLAITSYTSTNSTRPDQNGKSQTIYKVNPANEQEVLGGIYLSEAINIYASAVIKPDGATANKDSSIDYTQPGAPAIPVPNLTGNPADQQLANYVNNFLNLKECVDGTTPITDKFTESGSGVGYGGTDLAAVNSNDLGGKTIIVFYTVEFSNEANTFYSFVRSEGNNVYYKKDEINGSSNCYQLLNFNLNMLSLFAK